MYYCVSVQLKTTLWLLLKLEATFKCHKNMRCTSQLILWLILFWQMMRLDIFLVLKQTESKTIPLRKTGKCGPEHHYPNNLEQWPHMITLLSDGTENKTRTTGAYQYKLVGLPNDNCPKEALFCGNSISIQFSYLLNSPDWHIHTHIHPYLVMQ